MTVMNMKWEVMMRLIYVIVLNLKNALDLKSPGAPLKSPAAPLKSPGKHADARLRKSVAA